MSDTIKVYAKGSPEYTRLEEAAGMMTAMSPNGWHYGVEDTYFDFGQGWMWTTIVCDGGNCGSYQALTPRDHEAILHCEWYEEDLEDVVSAVFDDKFCPDC